MNLQLTTSGWEHYDHRADIGVRGYGPTISSAFQQAAHALTAVVVDPERVNPKQAIEITCVDDDIELLFVDWLNRLIYEMATRRMLFSHYEVEIEGGKLHAVIRGEPIDMERHQPAVEIKGATFTTLRVSQDTGGRWLAQTVVDV